MGLIERIRHKVLNEEYEFALPHFFEEMASDDLVWPDIEMAIANGRIRRRFTRDLEALGTRSSVRQLMDAVSG